MGIRGKIIATGLLTAALVGIAGPSAFAAYNYGNATPVSGTCYENGDWFTSNNVRTHTSGANSSRISFNNTPTKGIKWYVRDYNSGFGHGTIFAPASNTTWFDLADGDAPTKFENVYALTSSGHQSNYSFDGSEQY
ncbi:hypothetical protein ACEZDB_11500 [Streptacidiphilus sp. N1-3]|uniref:Peptidase inhibitor family I36 n=1 Tax=Streptacidiphilus alkalitolerans TaxID=3342712 RepID=A0ABV6WZX4_9ACTN